MKFNILVRELRQSFEDQATRNNKTHRLLLTAAVAADPRKIEQGYVVEEFCRSISFFTRSLDDLFFLPSFVRSSSSLDYVSVMTYDYHGE